MLLRSMSYSPVFVLTRLCVFTHLCVSYVLTHLCVFTHTFSPFTLHSYVIARYFVLYNNTVRMFFPPRRAAWSLRLPLRVELLLSPSLLPNPASIGGRVNGPTVDSATTIVPSTAGTAAASRDSATPSADRATRRWVILAVRTTRR